MTGITSIADSGTVYDVIIVGGGLGGLALAVGLGNMEGLNWLLVEAADELRTATGTLIGVGDNGLSALEGLDPRIVPKFKEVCQSTTHSERHQRFNDPSTPDDVSTTALSSALYTVRWAATQRVLARLVDQSKVLCGHRCTGYTEQPDGLIAVHFKGKPDIRAHFVVGADGVRSAIRDSLCPSDPGPRFLGYMNWNAVRHVPGSSSCPGAGTMKVILDRRSGFTTMVYIINAGCDYQFWQVRMTADQPCFTEGLSGGAGVPGSKARLLERMQQLGWQDVQQEIEGTDESLIYERAMWDRVPLASWSGAGNKVVLLGDAAHAMYSGPGQGARSAFEDAHQLFVAIKQHWPDAAAIAQQYEEARVRRATIIQNYAAAMANLKGLSQDMSSFWKQLNPDVNDVEAAQTRFREFQTWLNSYPDHVHGLPNSKYTSPAALEAFVEHCAEATARYKDSCLHLESAKVLCP